MKKLLRYVCAAAVLMLAQSAMAQEVTTVINEDFAAFAEGSENAPATTDISSGYPSKLSSELSGWSGRYVYEAGGALMIADNGNLQTARYSMKANNGIIKISMRVRSLDDSGAMFTIGVNSTVSVKVTDYVFDDKWHDVSYVVAGASTYSDSYIRFNAAMTISGILIDDLKVEQSASFFPAPVALQPVQADGSSFTAKWNYISGVGTTGYYLDVYSYDAQDAKNYAIQNQYISGAYTSSYKVTGLNPELHYYFVVRATNGTATSEDSNEIEVVKVITNLSAPVAQPATNVGENGFTDNWAAVDNAEGYVLSVTKEQTLQSNQNVVVISEDFAGITEGTISAPVYPSLQEYLDNYTEEKGWYAYYHLYANGFLGLAPYSESNPATLTSPAKDLSSNEGQFTVKVRMGSTQYGTYVAGNTVTVNIYNDQTLVEKQEVVLKEGQSDYELNFTKGNELTYVEFSFASTTDRVWIDSVSISQEKKAGEVVSSLLGSVVAGDVLSLAVEVPFSEGVSYKYAVSAYVNTVVSGEIGLLYSASSNEVEVKYNSSVAVDEVKAAKAVQSIRYVDLAGRTIAEPTQGVSIAVITYTDGTKKSIKMIK